MKSLIENSCLKLEKVRESIAEVIVGQEPLVDRLLLALLCDGHVLIEGVPGVAKTLVITTLAQSMKANFSRVQFTPDLLPSDLVGSLVYDPREHTFTAEKGPVFANLLLADEINRAPAKVQSALLESMQEKQVTLGKEMKVIHVPTSFSPCWVYISYSETKPTKKKTQSINNCNNKQHTSSKNRKKDVSLSVFSI